MSEHRDAPPSVEIITIGTELLLGSTVDSNSAHIGRGLAEIGLDLYAKHSVGDNAQRLAQTIRTALAHADGVITTGGLGPTVDDLTKDGIASALGLELELHEPSLRALEERVRRAGREVTENNRRQAILPRGAVVLANPHGTAPGFVALRADGRFVAAMPGVPREMRPMFAEQLVPWLRERFGLRGGIVTRTIRTVGIPESELDRRIEELFRTLDNPKIAVLAHQARVDVKIMAKVADLDDAAAMIAPVEADIRARIGAGIYGIDQETLEGRIIAAFTDQGLRLAVAESCTGGALCDALVSVPGASKALLGGVIAYDNAVKRDLLGVDPQMLATSGAVSAVTAEAMAAGALERLGADVALSTTGVAGPGGGTADKPVGLVFLGLARKGQQARTKRLLLSGDRADIRSRTVTAALAWLWEEMGLQSG